jgi:hypothetical protein
VRVIKPIIRDARNASKALEKFRLEDGDEAKQAAVTLGIALRALG